MAHGALTGRCAWCPARGRLVLVPWAITDARHVSVGPSGSARKVGSFAVCQCCASNSLKRTSGNQERSSLYRPLLPGTRRPFAAGAVRAVEKECYGFEKHQQVAVKYYPKTPKGGRWRHLKERLGRAERPPERSHRVEAIELSEFAIAFSS